MYPFLGDSLSIPLNYMAIYIQPNPAKTGEKKKGVFFTYHPNLSKSMLSEQLDDYTSQLIISVVFYASGLFTLPFPYLALFSATFGNPHISISLSLCTCA